MIARVTLPDGHKVDVDIGDVSDGAWGVMGTCSECCGTGEDWMLGSGYCSECNGYGVLLCAPGDDNEQTGA